MYVALYCPVSHAFLKHLSVEGPQVAVNIVSVLLRIKSGSWQS